MYVAYFFDRGLTLTSITAVVMSSQWNVRRDDQKIGLAYYTDTIERNAALFTLRSGRVFCAREKKKVEEPVIPLEPGKEKEKHAVDVVTERK